ncbi:MAG TPA: TIGR03032 family protein [Fimbriiglobus sp.]|nr:TIGR03032 family protein [Fimbriiglobus sp.]
MTAPDEPLRSVHTTSLPVVLDQLRLSLLVSTYQAGKLILVRSEGGVANTHFRNFQVPMGLALDRGRLAVGTRSAVWEYRDQPAAAARLEPTGRHDACFLPREAHFTGHIAIHEVAFGSGGELWAVNTRFSCLCTFDREHSFVPRWRPPFVSALTPEDRCHLNGLALVDGKPRFVTALGVTDTPGGWRADKARGGVLMEVLSGRVVASGLSMPHSPRWYDGRLWFLESGAGTLSTCDPATGWTEVVAHVPGFTRGLDFAGPLAFIGLSQVRETAVFSGIPITERLPVEERVCGMWVVDTRTGQTVAFLRFESGVQEVFAVLALPGMRFPELLNEEQDETVSNSFVLPDEALADVPR